jgi:malate dehydrogenase (oxaloacetate-decarboxylating)
MQGTGAITMAALFNGVALSGVDWKDHRVIVFGSGTAGVGIADQIRDQMTRSGLTEEEATRQFWLVDRQGLLLDDMDGLRDYQQGYARPAAEVTDWPRNGADGSISLTDTVTMAKPTIVIGTSTAPHTFTEAMVRTMAEHADRPIIFPLSNPTPLAEATPEQLLRWTGGRALVATGSPFDPVTVGKVTHTIGQANNAMLYPGLGLGVIVCRASKISDGMILAAAKAVASLADTSEPGSSLLPAFGDLRTVSATVAVAVVEQAATEGLATVEIDDVVEAVRVAMWQAEYTPIEAV